MLLLPIIETKTYLWLPTCSQPNEKYHCQQWAPLPSHHCFCILMVFPVLQILTAESWRNFKNKTKSKEQNKGKIEEKEGLRRGGGNLPSIFLISALKKKTLRIQCKVYWDTLIHYKLHSNRQQWKYFKVLLFSLHSTTI